MIKKTRKAKTEAESRGKPRKKRATKRKSKKEDDTIHEDDDEILKQVEDLENEWNSRGMEEAFHFVKKNSFKRSRKHSPLREATSNRTTRSKRLCFNRLHSVGQEVVDLDTGEDV